MRIQEKLLRCDQTSRLRTFRALSSMNWRRGSTSSPIKPHKHFLGLDGVGQFNAQQLAPDRIHRGLKKFLGVHFTQPLEAVIWMPFLPTVFTPSRISGIENSGVTFARSPSPSVSSNSGLSCAA
jgi:hypothetical protein